MASEGLIAFILVGLVAGWLAGQLVMGTGLGLVGDIIVGIAGAFIGGLLLAQLNFHVGVGIVSSIVNATIGAVALLLIIRVVSGGGGYRSRWGSYFGRRW